MPAKDNYHDQVSTALRKDGWKIIHDPLRVVVGKKDVYIDLGAEQLLTAEKGTRKIAVEIKSFSGHSEINDLHKTVGQFTIYHTLLARSEPDRELFVAMPEDKYIELFEDELIGQLLLEAKDIRLIVFDAEAKEIRGWKS